jgi:mono/diheme cytochrome c family protein
MASRLQLHVSNPVRRCVPACFAACALLLGAPQAANADSDPKRGNELFQQYCAGCHGPEGRGSRKSGFMPRPRNLTMKGYTDQLPDEYLFTVISKGGIAVNKSEYMPSFESTLAKEDIENVIAFIRTLVLH